MKTAITGSNGFLGSRIVHKLQSNDYEIMALIRKNANRELLHPNTNIVEINYNNVFEIEKTLNGQDVLIHSAALTRAKRWTDFQEINIKFTERLIEIFNRTKSLKQFIFISSQAAAGPSVNSKPKIESDLNNPVSYYGKSKLLAEQLIKKKIKKPYTILRPSSIYGQGDRDFLNYFKMINKGITVLPGKQKKFINLISADEVSEYVMHTINNKSAFNQTFFLTDGNIYSLDQFIKILKEVMHQKTKDFKIPDKLLSPIAKTIELSTLFSKKPAILNQQKVNEIKYNFWLSENLKAVKLLNYSPQNGLKNNLITTYNWYKKKGWL
ncbi:MAG: NAD-dependent epimerase/dehydratase family protein [Candidatus Cloacimonetes bacterium]|nr:NAD-dependent epimerase/dehydratase family protein [Candidatus Cloacimonadota bacterium]